MSVAQAQDASGRGPPSAPAAQSATADAIDGKAMRGSHSPIAERATHAWSLDSKSIWTDGRRLG